MSTKSNYYKLILESDHYSINDKILIITDLIANENRPEVLVQYYKHRAMLYYEEKKYHEVLNDINVVNQYGDMDEMMLMIKWISTIYIQMESIRNDIFKSLNLDIVDKADEALKLYNSISDAKLDKLIKHNSQKLMKKSIKRLHK